FVGGRFGFYGHSNYSNESLTYMLYIRDNLIRKAYEVGVVVSYVSGYQINGNYIDMRTDNTSNYGFTHCNGSTGGGQTYEVIGNTFANCGQYGIQYLTPNNNGAKARIWNNFFQGTW